MSAVANREGTEDADPVVRRGESTVVAGPAITEIASAYLRGRRSLIFDLAASDS